MTVTGILPSYQRFVNGVPVPFSRKSFRQREKYIIFLVFITFGFVCFGTFFFLPEFKGSKSTAESVYQVYDKIKRAGPELLIPPPPHLDDEKDSLKIPVIRHDAEDQIDPHIIDDKAKLQAKIEQDEQLKVLERPDMEINLNNDNHKKVSSTSKPIVQIAEEEKRDRDVNENAIVTVPPAISNHYPQIRGGEDEDEETRQRRDKIKEVGMFNQIVYVYVKEKRGT
ncbi:mannosyl-oligosaccharide 1,2-alpha-mannosidase IB-like [Photinus pyralis]|uniref:mannosyl-oligosaccharide 1,2-alpha-mannosidase IB-like n=1 Tax=Photinus pyralis TaxID=7054 RepID=UPI00126748EE|nr:mannosyl-oligosaccharide 1,2-alpha-mannosidase IB-like [Photinus pyralis]